MSVNTNAPIVSETVTAPTPVVGRGMLWYDSVANAWQLSNDGGAAERIGAGLTLVEDIATRDALTGVAPGGIVFVQENGMAYKRNDTGTDWVIETYGLADATTTTLYVNTSTGSDENPGSLASPLATVQCAVYKFLPPHGPARTIAYGTPLTVHVTGNVTGRLHKPFHQGDGELLIAFAETVVHSGIAVVSGAATSAAYHALRRLTVAPGSFTADVLAKNSFVRPVSPSFPTSPMEIAQEQVTVYGNATGSIDVIYASAGNPTALAALDTFDVVRPLYRWTLDNAPQPVQSYQGTGSMITNDGGCLVITGAEFYGTTTNYTMRRLVTNRTDGNTHAFSQSFAVSRCVFTSWRAPILDSYSAACACILNATTAYSYALIVPGAIAPEISSVLMTHTTAPYVIEVHKCSQLYVFGLIVECASGQPIFLLKDSTIYLMNYFDFRSAQMVLSGCSAKGWGDYLGLYNGSFENCGSAYPLVLEGNSHAFVATMIGSTGNTAAAGAYVTGHSHLYYYTGTFTPVSTLAGSGGQVKVGSHAAVTWATMLATPEVDAGAAMSVAEAYIV